MNLTLYKLVLLIMMIGGTIIAGLSPLKILRKLRHEAATADSSRKHKKVSLFLCLLTCFSGGVFLATCFLHLFPELREQVDALEQYGLNFEYPIAELLACLGFFLLFFLEEVIIMAIPAMAHGHAHGGSHGHGNHGEHHHQEATTAPAAEGGSSSCCMIDVPTKPVEEKKKALVDTADETTRLTAKSDDEKEGEGHCQTHCPLTVHDRRGSGKEECTAPVAPVAFAPLAFAEPERCETNCDAVDEDPPILMKSRPHAHSHGVRSITFVLALSIHSVIEGIAFGVQGEASEVTALFISLMVHKLIVAFTVGLQLARTHAHQLKWVVISIVLLACMSPLGALLGMMVSNASEGSIEKDITITILQGLAVGTFIYVTFFEVLLHERDNEHPNLLKLLVMFVGFCLIGSLRLMEGSHDHSGHSHSHEHHEETVATLLTTLVPPTSAHFHGPQ